MAAFDARDLLACYARGVFPMADARDDDRVFLIDPERRGVIPLDRFHVSRRLARTVRGDPFEVRVNTAFQEVVQACAAAKPGRLETWINYPIEALYTRLHELGHAHSIECWSGGELVGGLYGVSLKAAFFGESMFSRRTDASKVALVHLVARLIAGGYRLLDAQFLTDHLTQFGAEEVSRDEYHRRLAAALEHEADFYGLGGAVGVATTSGSAPGVEAAGAAGGAGLVAAAFGGAAGGVTGVAALQVISQAS
ncbi:MAG: leucyl/phenylalanyl-tRNA--protein transferase [Proteobacteria bacterium]|nr:leucyl/phenylalanyl-tRNA--protein transferase [Pseudomonadota bacterium]